MDFDLPSLDTFVRLADCGSFSEVARAQRISQPAVSCRVAKLESALGLHLFARQAEGLKLTRDGSLLLDQARLILREHEGLGVRMAHFLRESRGVVKVMVDLSTAGSRLVNALEHDEGLPAPLEIIRPNAACVWDEALRGHMVDIVVTATFLNAGDQASLQRYDLERQQGTTIAWNRAYYDFAPERFQFPEVLRSTILVPGEGLVPGYRRFLERWCQDSYGSLPPDISAFDDEAMARDACCAGLGVMIFPGDAEIRMGLAAAGLGMIKTFEFLLPEAYSYSIFIRAGERSSQLLRTAMRIRELHKDVDTVKLEI